MKKTPVGSSCDARLTAINDQLCFGAFSAQELNQALAVQALPPGTMTSAAFAANPHASRIDRRLSELPAFEAAATRTLCASALIAASEHIQDYCKASRKELRRLTGNTSVATGNGEDEKLQSLLKTLGAPVMDEIFQTVIYLRLRRNHLVHQGPLNATLQNFLANGGAAALNSFWGSRPTKLFGFDFLNRDLAQFIIEDGYAVMNLLRICLKTIDEWVAARLPIPQLAEGVARDLVARFPGLRNEIPGLTRKTVALMKIHYGAQVTAAQISAPVRAARAI